MKRYLNKIIRNKKGFTLLELVIVITILGILISLAVPKYMGIKTEAENNAKKATARIIASAVTMAKTLEGEALTNSNGAEQINKFLEGIEITTGTTKKEDGWVVNLLDDDTFQIWAPGEINPVYPFN